MPKQNIDLSETQIVNKILAEYRLLVEEIGEQTANLRIQLGGQIPCAPNCYGCCITTATLPISEVEGLDLKNGLIALPESVRSYVRWKANRTIGKLTSLGYSLENIIPDSGNKALDAIKGSQEAECPLLIGGVCSVYKQRPILCHIWGYPMFNGDEVACCRRTFKGNKYKVKPIDYTYYWNELKRLSKKQGADEKTPICYLVIRLLESLPR